MRKIIGYPLEVHDVQPEEMSDVSALFLNHKRDYIRIGPKGYLIPKSFENYLSDIYNMPLKPRDIFVTSYQRSGTTLMQEMVWLLANNLDYDTAATVLLAQRWLFLEEFMLFEAKGKQTLLESVGNTTESKQLLKQVLESLTENLASATDPRFVKTHMPFSMLPHTLLDTAKVLYVARDPRDVAVSLYHFCKLFTMIEYTGDFKQFWNMFIENKCLLTPYFEHVKEAWALRHNPNMLFLFYEDLSKNLKGSVDRVASFLGKEYTQEKVSGLCDHLSIEKFKHNKSVNYEVWRPFGQLKPGETFIREGKVGGWRNYFDAEMTQQAEQWICNNLQGTDLLFPSMGDVNVLT